MARERVSVDVDYVVREYRAGRSGVDIARELGVGFALVYHRLREAGVTIRPNRPATVAVRTRVPVAQIVRLYARGWSENRVAEHFGVSRNVIAHRLRRAGVARRDQSAAERLKWSRMSRSARARQVQAAHNATRGRTPTMQARCRLAETVQARGLHISPSEIELAMMLRERGIEPIPQQAIGPYNCDLGASPVAVEVFGGHWHWHGRHLLRTPKRLRYLMDAGWHVVIVQITQAHPLTAAAADYIAALVERARREPSAIREYRVIRGAAETLAAGRADDDEITIVPALTIGRHPTTGRYQRIPRHAPRM